MNNGIKSFVYLDEYKLYSVSSQLFEGLTEYVISGSTKKHSEEASQKGQILSGKLMGDILSSERSSTEKKILHDYAFNLLEAKLEELGKILPIDTIDALGEEALSKFVKVKGRIIFDDYKILRNTLDRFNDIGAAIGYAALKSSGLEDIDALAAQSRSKAKDRNAKAKISNVQKAFSSKLRSFLQEQGLMLDEKMIAGLTLILEYSFKDQLGIRIPLCDSKMVTATLNRDYLRESMDLIIPKYSRKSEIEFTIVGVLTQCGFPNAEICSVESDKLKRSVQHSIDQLAGLEDQFSGRLENEYVIDPIAIYREI